TQHRMHPEISSFPLHLFNESRLADNTAMAVKQSAPWHADKKYPPFGFINVTWKKENIELWPHADSNVAECIAAVRLVYNLCTDYSHLPWKHRIGVIAPNIYQLGLAIHVF
ncbi:DEAD-box type RNA helicase, partial [Coemansia sp. RSA 1933]